MRSISVSISFSNDLDKKQEEQQGENERFLISIEDLTKRIASDHRHDSIFEHELVWCIAFDIVCHSNNSLDDAGEVDEYHSVAWQDEIDKLIL